MFFIVCTPSYLPGAAASAFGIAACEPDKSQVYFFVDICVNYPGNIVVIFLPLRRRGLLWALALLVLLRWSFRRGGLPFLLVMSRYRAAMYPMRTEPVTLSADWSRSQTSFNHWRHHVLVCIRQLKLTCCRGRHINRLFIYFNYASWVLFVYHCTGRYFHLQINENNVRVVITFCQQLFSPTVAIMWC